MNLFYNLPEELQMYIKHLALMEELKFAYREEEEENDEFIVKICTWRMWYLDNYNIVLMYND